VFRQSDPGQLVEVYDGSIMKAVGGAYSVALGRPSSVLGIERLTFYLNPQGRLLGINFCPTAAMFGDDRRFWPP
jgi:hypothetical protein